MYILSVGFAFIFTGFSTALATTPVDPFADTLLDGDMGSGRNSPRS